jgi:hypothetical protein
MEIRNTAAEPELEWLDTPELIQQLMIGLRNVALHEVYLPTPSENMVLWIELVQRIQRLPAMREAELIADLEKLSAEIGWLMRSLLEELWFIPAKRGLPSLAPVCQAAGRRDLPKRSP